MKIKSRGFTLVEVLIVMGLVSGLALFLAKLTNQQVKVSTTGTLQFEVNAFVSQVSNVTNSPQGCKATFANYAIPVKMNGDPVEIDKIWNNSTGTTPLITSGDNIAKDLVLDRMEVSIIPSQFDYTTGRAVGNLELFISKTSENNIGASTIRRSIPFNVKLTSYRIYYSASADLSTTRMSATNRCITDSGVANVELLLIETGSNPPYPTPFTIYECFPVSANQVFYVDEC